MPDETKYLHERLDVIADKVSETNAALKAHIAKFDSHLDWADQARQELKHMDSTLEKNTTSLELHIHRTNLLEEFVKKVETRFTPIEVEHIRVRAVNDWIQAKLKFLAKLGAGAAALGTLSVATKLLIQYILTH